MNQREIINAILEQNPSIKTQAQLDIFLAALDVVRYHLSNIFEEKPTDQSLTGVHQTFEAAKSITELARVYREVPEAQGEASKFFVDPPQGESQYLEVQSLIFEMQRHTKEEQLNSWLESVKDRLTKVTHASHQAMFAEAVKIKIASLGLN